MGEPHEPEVPTGLGGYDVVRRIAVGGMAEVILARHTVRPGIARMVVLKTILPGLSEQADLVTMFLSEARIAAQLQHPNVVHIHDVTRLGARPCIVMEHLVGLDGRGLQRKLHERGQPLPIGILAAIGEGAALGLGYAHRARGVDGQALAVVHRDVSPHNLFVTVDGIVKVLDFGIAKSTAQLQTTREGTLKGKIAYMSPEQLRGDVLDGRSDLFALGAVLWELATGQALFARGMEVESFAAVMELKIPPPSAVRPDVPAAFDRAVMRALERDRTRRPANGEEMARELHAVAEATCDGPPGQAVAALVRALIEEDEASATADGDPTDPMRAPTMTLASAAPSAPAFGPGALGPSGPLSPPRGEGGVRGRPRSRSASCTSTVATRGAPRTPSARRLSLPTCAIGSTWTARTPAWARARGWRSRSTSSSSAARWARPSPIAIAARRPWPTSARRRSSCSRPCTRCA